MSIFTEHYLTNINIFKEIIVLYGVPLMSFRSFMFYHLLDAGRRSCKTSDEIHVGHVRIFLLILQLYVACLLVLSARCVWR
jgi:hypothetical protein